MYAQPGNYPQYQGRRVHALDGLWDFAFLGDVKAEAIQSGKIRYTDKMVVPQAYDALPAYAGKRGVAAYRTGVSVKAGLPGRLHFQGVSMWCRVFVDGRRLMDHACGYTGFWCDVPPAACDGEREIVVLTDNRYDFARIPLHENFFDFYNYGGLIRTAAYHELPALYVEDVAVCVLDYRKGIIQADIRLGGAVPARVDLAAAFDGRKPALHRDLRVRQRHVRLELAVPDPRPWSPQRPALHRLAVGMAGDVMTVRFGLREVRVKGRAFLLNGEPLKLLGFCRHESHPQFGPAVPLAQMQADIQLLKDMGCNFVRGSHYPQDQRFLDLCDEFGILVWEENIGWGQGEKQLTSDAFIRAQEESIAEMVAASRNHPSVILWGILNEGASHQPFARRAYSRLLKRLRALDPSRPVTYASNRGLADRFLDLVDVVSINMYPAWYSHLDTPDPIMCVRPYIRSMLAGLTKKGQGNKPFIISEIGAAALYGWRDLFERQWTEAYQARLLSEACKEVVSNLRITGIAIWQFCDMRTYQTGPGIFSRPRGFNNKGVLDDYRRPKAAYQAVKEVFAGVRALKGN